MLQHVLTLIQHMLQVTTLLQHIFSSDNYVSAQVLTSNQVTNILQPIFSSDKHVSIYFFF